MRVFAAGGGGREKRMNEPCRPTDRPRDRKTEREREREAASSREMKIGESQINMSIFAAAAAGAAVFALNSFADVDIVLR